VLWGFAAPVVVLGVYAARFPRTRIHTGFGARLGLLSGLAIALTSLTINGVALVLERFAFHASASMDGQIEQIFAQMRTSVVARSSAADAQSVLRWLAIPEFRAGLVLASVGMMLVLYLAYSALAGAFAGALRSRRGAQD
jgi:ABC-type methionine transport system permease subunit